LASCGGDPDAAASDATVLEIELGRYTISPSTMAAPAGALDLIVTNVDDALVHNLVVAGKGTRQLAPGESQTISIEEIAAGDYRMWCDVVGHAQAGQTGALRVDPAPAATATTTAG
jgi:uncharacterized cupredoxin-like copper-binding protein